MRVVVVAAVDLSDNGRATIRGGGEPPADLDDDEDDSDSDDYNDSGHEL